MSTSNEEKLSLWSAVSIGIGGMVGGGIFAVLGYLLPLLTDRDIKSKKGQN